VALEPTQQAIHWISVGLSSG